MNDKKQVIAISGSARKNSANLRLIRAIEQLTSKFDITIFDGLTALPHFNPDLDSHEPPDEVTRFRQTLRHADGVLICTPEYAMGVPGTLKNALDWTVSSGELSGKPVALITASTSGRKAHESLLLTLETIEAKIVEETQYVIPFIQVKVNAQSQITDDETMSEIQKLVSAFQEQMDGR